MEFITDIQSNNHPLFINKILGIDPQVRENVETAKQAAADAGVTLDALIGERSPEAMALEEIFFSKNPKSTMILGEVRGVVLLAAAEGGVDVFEYSAREVKGSVVGSGAAHKSQVSGMIRKILSLDHEPESEDETDALAVAFCHALRISGFNPG